MLVALSYSAGLGRLEFLDFQENLFFLESEVLDLLEQFLSLMELCGI